MAGNFRFGIGETDTDRFLKTTVGSFLQDRLIDKEQRIQQKEQCAERLAAEDGTSDKDTEIRYSDQAVLANLDWGIDALEEAINTSTMETKLARLDYAEKMLQVCAMLNSSYKTAGVPNFYLSAWAHLNLSCMWVLRNNVHNAVLHVLEMFTVDPFFSRIDFAPELWKTLFLPHMSSIIGWYSEERYRLMMEVIPDSTDLSFTGDFDQYFNESLILSMRPDQAEKMQMLEQVYGQSLDENTKLYAKYYRDCMTFDSTTSKKAIPMMPIVEPPMTPLHEVSRSIPDYVKFGPILPKSAGFSPLLRYRENAREASRLSETSTSSHHLKETATWVPQEGIPEENEVDSIEESDALGDMERESLQYEDHERESGSFPYEEQEQEHGSFQYEEQEQEQEHGSFQYEERERGSFQYEEHDRERGSFQNDEQDREGKSLRYEKQDLERGSFQNKKQDKESKSLRYEKQEREHKSFRYEEQKEEHVSHNSFVKKKEEDTVPNIHPIKVKSRMNSPRIVSPNDSTAAGSPKTSSSMPNRHSKKESPSMSRLLSFRVRDPTISVSLPTSPQLRNDVKGSPGGSDGEMKKSRRTNGHARSMSYASGTRQMTQNSYIDESDEGSQSCVSLPLSEKLSSHSRPPKDFVCPITSQIFCDPVTLETGQTYERNAIQEWVKRGNTTCPITRQLISATSMPKTNYVLKRLITSWKEQHPDLAQEFSYANTPRSSLGSPASKENLSETTPSRTSSPHSRRTRNGSINNKTRRFTRGPVATSPTSVISQAALETIINDLKPYITCLCTSEDLKECESAVLTIGRIWKNSKYDPGLHSYISKGMILNGFVEILSASMNREVLRTSVCILSKLIFADNRVYETLTRIDCDFDCLASLLKNGLAEASVLIYQLKPTFSQLSSLDLIPSLVQLILTRNEDLDEIELVMEPEDAAVAILEQILMGGDENSRSVTAMTVISANGISALVKRLDRVEGRQAIVCVLLCCIHADKACKNLIASRIEFSPVLELFHAGNDTVRGICIDFLSELVQLNRRTFCNQVLKIIKDEGAFSTMHTFLVYLQMAPMEQQPVVATLLLQLDLLVEPRKMSVYREEAIETLIEALCNKDFPNSQIAALDALLSLSGRLTSSGKPYTEAWLLKIAGFDQNYNALMREERPKTHEIDWTVTMEEEEKATSSWEKRVAFVLCNHEKGSIFRALEECLLINSLEMAKSCLVIATWLVHMLYCLPDTGVRDVARKALLDQFINVLQKSKNIEEKILATLALKSFIADPGALNELAVHVKFMYKTLRKLKRNSTMVNDILKTLMNLPSVDATELWCCAEVAELDSSANGEVLCLLHLKGRIISSHSDGTIKVWDAGKSVPRLVQEVREHVKAVTCLYFSSSGDKLFSGSMDKTIRVWVIKQDAIHCVYVHDVKDAVLELTANSNFACFSTQGTGVKIYNWSGVPKHINFNKNVKSLAMTGTKLYCGCTGYSIQEVDLTSYTSSVFYAGAKKILGKQNIHSLRIHNGLLFAGGSSVDGIAGKVFSLSTKATIGSFSTALDIHCMAVNNEHIFTASKGGVIEVWLKERVTRVAYIKMPGGGLSKITSLASDSNGEMLFAGCSEGKIQAWGLE